jgi:hypothetical protein
MTAIISVTPSLVRGDWGFWLIKREPISRRPKPGVGVCLDVWAEAQTYLRSEGNGKNNGNRRSPAGMTNKKTTSRTMATADPPAGMTNKKATTRTTATADPLRG